MAAWTARIDAIADAGNFESVIVSASYFDAADTGFVTALWQRAFTFEFGSSAAEIAGAIRAQGQQQRAVQAKVATLQSQVGATVAVP